MQVLKISCLAELQSTMVDFGTRKIFLEESQTILARSNSNKCSLYNLYMQVHFGDRSMEMVVS